MRLEKKAHRIFFQIAEFDLVIDVEIFKSADM
jgi:hypothetical protein